jgi:hypothetical protein
MFFFKKKKGAPVSTSQYTVQQHKFQNLTAVGKQHPLNREHKSKACSAVSDKRTQ